MTPELTALAVAALLWIVHLATFGAFVRRQGIFDYQVSNREAPPPHRGPTLRAQKALANFAENLPLFVAAVVVVSLAGRSTAFTAFCAWAFVAARLLYIPAYVAGWPKARGLLWVLGLLATLSMIFAALFQGAS